jgi:hypothetical protein
VVFVGLAEFAASPERSQKGGTCWTCSIPERDEIDRAHRENGVGALIAIDWLIKECGYGEDQRFRQHSLKSHFNHRHHERQR